MPTNNVLCCGRSNLCPPNSRHESEGYCCPGWMQPVHGLPHPQEGFPCTGEQWWKTQEDLPQDDRALKRIAHSNRFKSTTSITHLWNETMTSPVSRSTTYRQLRFHGFSSRIPCTKPLLSCKQKKNVYSLHRSIPSGRWRTGSK